jgi:peroxiredoxin
MFCREQAVQLHRDRQRFLDRGATVAFVGNGGALFARTFVEDYHLDEPVLVDPSRATYRALGMGRVTLGSLLSPSTLLASARAMAAGFFQGKTQGHALQLGGVLAVRPGGEVAYRYLSRFAGDHPPHDQILAKL